ncbi:MAG: beta-ketoacyl synthase N-terminal-like domain-containing protein, partial [Armatimonadota bacterium]
MAQTVVITGVGPISAIGIGREDFCGGLDEGRMGIRPPERVQVGDTGVENVAECLDFYVEDYLESEKTYLDRASELLLAACHLALEDGALGARAMDHERIGLSIGTAYGCLGTMADYYRRVLEKGARFASTVLFTHTYANTPISLASIEYGIMGPTNTVCTGVTSGAGAISYAFDLLRHGRTDAMLAGGMDAL